LTETRTKTILATVIVKWANKNGQQIRLVILIEKLEFVLLVFVWLFLTVAQKGVFFQNAPNVNFLKKSLNVET
jgi:hypothetical protein